MHAKVAHFFRQKNIVDHSDAPSSEWILKVYEDLVRIVFPFVDSPNSGKLVDVYVYISRSLRLIQIDVRLGHLLSPSALDATNNLNRIGEYMELRESYQSPFKEECIGLLAEQKEFEKQRAIVEQEILQLEKRVGPKRGQYAAERQRVYALIEHNKLMHAKCESHQQLLESLNGEAAKKADGIERLRASIKDHEQIIARLLPLVKSASDGKASIDMRIEEQSARLGQLVEEQKRLRAVLEEQDRRHKQVVAVEPYMPILRECIEKHQASTAKLEASHQAATKSGLDLESHQRETTQCRLTNKSLREQLKLLGARYERVKRLEQQFSADQAARAAQLNEEIASLGSVVANDRGATAELQRQLRLSLEHNQQTAEMLSTRPPQLASAIARLDIILKDVAN